MTEPGNVREARRVPWNKHQVLRTAIDLADGGGIDSLSMRKLSQALGGATMSLYNHVADKEDLLDGMIDIVFGEIGLPSGGADWKTSMRERATSLLDVLGRHRWAIGLMESRRRPGPANLRHHDAVIGKLRAAGFDVAMVAHAYSLLDGYIYGFALTNLSLPFDTTDEMTAMAEDMFEPFPAGEYPNLAEFVADHVMQPGYDFGAEFAYGLDLILDGLEMALNAMGGFPPL